VVHLWSLDSREGECAEGAERLDPLLDLTVAVPALLRSGVLGGAELRLGVVTRGAADAGHEAASGAAAGAAWWALQRVVQAEHPELRCRAVDLGAEATDPDAQQLLRLLLGGTSEDRLALRDGIPHAPRLVPLSQTSKPDGRIELPSTSAYRID